MNGKLSHNVLRRVIVSAVISGALTSPAFAAKGVDSSLLRVAVTVDGVRAHQQIFQNFADANGGTRLAGTNGYDESAQYVYDLLAANGFNVQMQPFDFISFNQLGASTLAQTAPGAVIYVECI